MASTAAANNFNSKLDATSSSTGGAPGNNVFDDSAIELATAHVHESLRSLLADELPDLADSKGHKVFTDPYLYVSYESFKSYLHFLYTTWVNVIISFWHLLKGQIKVYDFLCLAWFSALVSGVLTMGVLTCLMVKLPLVERLSHVMSILNGGFSSTNALNTHMFSSLTSKEVRFSKAALASTAPVKGKEFNLEVAKLLLLFASVVYERTAEATRESVKHTHSVPRLLRRGKSTSPRNGSPLANSPSPASPLTPPTSRSTHSRHSSHHARSLSHFASQMQSSLTQVHKTAQDSHLLKVFGKSASQIRAILHSGSGDNVIQDLVGRLDVEYEPVSELNSASSSFAALFWDKRQNWVVVAFKGTSPAEFDEWLTDFDITRVAAGHRLPGYKEVHRGFKNRLFPDKDGAHRTPYETIMAAIKIVTNDLASRTDKPINLWFCGHSLGCAMASLSYTRAMLGLDGLNPRVELCDAYLYGAPVVCDMASAKVFNDYMNHRQTQTGKTRTIWRVTNHSDAVTTLLPMLGDDPLYPNTTSLFAYAHLGSEVKMRAGAGNSIIVDNYCTPNTPARVISCADNSSFESDDETEVDHPIGYGMGRAEYAAFKEGKSKRAVGVPWWISGMEYLPLFGRMVSHFPGLYFRSLQQMAPGDFQWRRA